MHRAGRRQLRLHLVGVVVGETSRPQVCLAFPRPLSSFWTSHTTPAIVRHIIALIIANAFWAAGATAQSMSPNRRVRALSADQLAGTGRAPAEYGARDRDDARRLSMVGDLRRRGPLRWCPLHALQPEHHDRYRQFVCDVASRAARRQISGWRPMAAACRASPAANSRSTPCEMGCRATSSCACSKTTPGRSGSAPMVAV